MEEVKKKINELGDNLNLLNSQVTEIKIYSNNDLLFIDLSFSLDGNDKKIKFCEVIEYEFYHNSTYIFYNVEDYKFFATKENQIYLSLDPNFDVYDISTNDKDFILAKDFEFVW